MNGGLDLKDIVQGTLGDWGAGYDYVTTLDYGEGCFPA